MAASPHSSHQAQDPGGGESKGDGPSPATPPGRAGLAPAPGHEESWQRALEKGRCVHCEVPQGSGWEEQDGPFCCRGCRSVYYLLHGEGLDRFYDIAGGRQAAPAQLGADTFAWLDRLLAASPARTGGAIGLALDVQGVHCAACVWLLEELFRRQDGGVDLRINPSLGKVDVTWDLTKGDLRDYLREAERFGYRFGPPQKEAPRRSRAVLYRMAICISIALNVMTFTLCYYFGLARGETLYDAFGRINLVLATVSVAVGGPVFFKGALASLRRRIAHLDLPIALGMALAYLGSVWAYFTTGPEGAYFDSLTVFVALMLIGRFAQERILERNRNSLLASSGAEQIIVKRQRGSELSAVPAPEIVLHDELWVAPGDLVPVSSTLLRREAELTLDWITGESDQRSFEPGDTVPAGAFNAGQQGLTVVALEDFADSRLHDLLRSGPSPSEEEGWRPTWWGRLASWYVLAVLGLGMLAFLVWLPVGSKEAIEVTVALLVVTCPCALGLAAPLAEELTFFALRRRGVFVRRGELMDKALLVRKVLLDKTGTLTLGRLSLDAESRRRLWTLAEPDRAILRALVTRSNHPASRCLAHALGPVEGEGLDAAGTARIDELKEVPGQGLSLEIDNVIYRVGKPAFSRGGCEDDPGVSSDARSTLFTRDGAILAAFGFKEDFKADASAEIRRLQAEGFELWLLSGDLPDKVKAAARDLGLPEATAVGGLTPEDKAALIREIDDGDTLMVGDGLNDSPAFEAALCAGTPAVDRPVLPGKADFYFLGDGIAAVRWTLAASRRLRRIVRDNLIVAVVYNVVAVGLCFAGVVTPVVAAVLMPLSSISVVVLTGLRLSGRRLGW